MQKFTVVESILVAARELTREGKSFSAEDLVVKSWHMFPDRFGLQGYGSKHPDSNRVLTKIMGGSSTLRKRCWIRKVGTKKYQLTPLGIIEADRLLASKEQPNTRLSEVDRGLIPALRRMLNSTALGKFSRNEPLTFGDVCGFWNISPRSTAAQFADRKAEADAAISAALESSREEDLSLPGGMSIYRSQLLQLKQLSSFLLDEFVAEIAVIEQRTDERRF